MQLDGTLAGIGAEPLADDDPRQIGSFPIRAVLGSGGMGRVYLGLAPTGLVAVKRVRPDLAKDKKFLVRFDAELDNQGRLPAGVSPRLLATDRTAQPPWFATEYVAGITLDQAVDLAGGRLPVSGCWILLREIATRLHALADLGMVHRDLKPSNIMLTADGVRLIDFGLSLMTLQTRLTTVTGTVGTPPFMAPEQLSVSRAVPTPAADVFALGGVITYAATGEPPFGYDPAVGYRIEHQEPDLDALREADPALAAVVASCLAKAPGSRPAAAELSRARAAPPTPSWPAPVSDHISRLQTLIPLQMDMPGPGTVTSPTASAPAAALASRPARDRAHETGPTGLGAGPAPSSPPRPVAHRPASHRRASHRSVPSPGKRTVPPPGKRTEKRAGERRRRRLMLGLIPLIITIGGGITAISLSSLAQPRPKPSSAASAPAPHPSPSPTHSKRTLAHVPTPAPAPPAAGSTPAATPARISHSPGVVSFTSYAMLENKAMHLCLADIGNLSAEALPCTGAKSQAWKAAREPGNAFTLTSGAYGDCLNDNYSVITTYPCTSSNMVTTYWRIGTTSSAGATLVDITTGECISAPVSGDSGFITTTCNPTDPRQLWYNPGKT